MSNNLETPIKTYLSELNRYFKDNKIRKRDGKTQKFDIFKILTAIHKSFDGKDCHYTYANITYEVCHDLLHSPKYKTHSTFELEHVQDVIEKILMRNYPDIAKKFIIYREQRRKVREDKNLFDVSSIMNDYMDQVDWRVKENSSTTYSIGGLILHNATSVISRYCLKHIYPKQIADAHINGDIHIHDLGFGIGVYCQGHSLGQLIEKGIVGLNGNLAAAPAKRFHTLINHMINFVGILQNESAGAQAFGSVDTYTAPFIAYDKLEYPQVKQIVQSFIFGMNVPSRWGSQAPFFNLTLDLTTNPVLAPKPVVVGGQWWKKTDELVPINSCNFDNEGLWHYKDFQKEMDMFNTAFLELMHEGDYDSRGFSYPIPTINLTKEFNWDSPVANLLWKLAGKLGTPYFSNFINSDMKPEDSFSMCCRLRCSLRELRKRGGGLFGAGEHTGSVGVVTLNLPRIAYKLRQSGIVMSDTPMEALIDEYKKALDPLLELAKNSLEIKRKTINASMEKGLFPYTKEYTKHFDNHFSTIGILGMHEACLNLFSKSIADPMGREFALDIGNYIREKILTYQTETGNLYNYEATPGESTSYRFAKIDKNHFPDIITSGEENGYYYTNSTNLPVGQTDDIFEAIDHQDDLMSQYTGGCVFHAHIGEMIPDPETVKNLVKGIATKYKMPYFSLSPTFSICKSHGYLVGKQQTCPTCGEPTEIFARIVGYYRPVKNWNNGKQQEFQDRKTYVIK